MSLIEKIGIGNLLNCILVNEGVRPAMLIQPADYGEATGNDIKTKFIIQEIKNYFPKFILSEYYKIYQGIIISKTNYNGQEISLEQMGEILGYPCYKDYNNINPDEISYCINIYVNNIQLFANVCKDESCMEIFKCIAEKAKIAFDKMEYIQLLNNFKFDKIIVETDKIIPTQTIINNLIENKLLNHDEINKIQNILFNFGFTMKLQIYFLDNFQYTNPIHKGILLGLLLNEKNNILTPFFPLQNYIIQQTEVCKITKSWENCIIDILDNTRQLNI